MPEIQAVIAQNTVTPQLRQTEVDQTVFRHAHSDGSVETVIGRENVFKACSELGKIAIANPELANAMVDLAVIEIDEFDIDALLNEKFEREDNAKSDAQESKPEPKIEYETKEDALQKLAVVAIEDNHIEEPKINTDITQFTEAEYQSHPSVNKQVPEKIEQTKTEYVKKKKIAEKPTEIKPKITHESEIGKEDPKTQNQYKTDAVEKLAVREMPEPQVQNITSNESITEKFSETQNSEINSVSSAEILEDEVTTDQVEAVIEKALEIEGMEYFDSAEAEETESELDTTTTTEDKLELITDSYVQETFDLIIETVATEKKVYDSAEEINEPTSIVNSFELFIEEQPDPEPMTTLVEIKEIANQQPVEQTFIQVINLVEKESPEFQEIADLILEISDLITEQINNPESDLAITKEIVEKILNLLTVLGYENPQEALLDLITRHDLEFLVHSIQYMSQLMNEDNQQEFLVQKTPLSFISNITDALSAKLGRISLAYYLN